MTAGENASPGRIRSKIENHSLSYEGLSSADKNRLKNSGCEIYTGKVRDMVRYKGELFMVHSDRLTAFDRLITLVPGKGILLTALADFWLQKVQGVCQTHYLGRCHSRILRVKPATPIKVEVVVRGYLAGSMLRSYQKGRRIFADHKLPDGLVPHQKLPQPILTPTTKAEAFEHDEETTAQELIDSGIVERGTWEQITAKAFRVFDVGTTILENAGWILADTKYEFGLDERNNLLLIDEVHTPDSSRFWSLKSYDQRLSVGEPPDMFDKELVRNDLLGQGFSGHGEVPMVPGETIKRMTSAYREIAIALGCDGLSESCSQHQVVERILESRK